MLYHLRTIFLPTIWIALIEHVFFFLLLWLLLLLFGVSKAAPFQWKLTSKQSTRNMIFNSIWGVNPTCKCNNLLNVWQLMANMIFLILCLIVTMEFRLKRWAWVFFFAFDSVEYFGLTMNKLFQIKPFI